MKEKNGFETHCAPSPASWLAWFLTALASFPYNAINIKFKYIYEKSWLKKYYIKYNILDNANLNTFANK